MSEHNIHNITPEQVPTGARLLNEDEIPTTNEEADRIEAIRPYTCRSWIASVRQWSTLWYNGCSCDLTYCTTLTPAELLAARGLALANPKEEHGLVVAGTLSFATSEQELDRLRAENAELRAKVETAEKEVSVIRPLLEDNRWHVQAIYAITGGGDDQYKGMDPTTIVASIIKERDAISAELGAVKKECATLSQCVIDWNKSYNELRAENARLRYDELCLASAELLQENARLTQERDASNRLINLDTKAIFNLANECDQLAKQVAELQEIVAVKDEALKYVKGHVTEAGREVTNLNSAELGAVKRALALAPDSLSEQPATEGGDEVCPSMPSDMAPPASASNAEQTDPKSKDGSNAAPSFHPTASGHAGNFISRLSKAAARATCDPDSCTSRGDNYQEPIHQWERRAKKIAVGPFVEELAKMLTPDPAQWVRREEMNALASHIGGLLGERTRLRASIDAMTKEAAAKNTKV